MLCALKMKNMWPNTNQNNLKIACHVCVSSESKSIISIGPKWPIVDINEVLKKSVLSFNNSRLLKLSHNLISPDFAISSLKFNMTREKKH